MAGRSSSAEPTGAAGRTCAPQPKPLAEQTSGMHADANCFAVQVGSVPRQGFHHMAQGVAVIEDRPQAAFPFVMATTRALAAAERRRICCISVEPMASRLLSGPWASRASNSTGSPITPYLITSAMPA